MDTTCAACEDFYQFANGGWLARTDIPPAYASWGSFTELAEHNNDVLHGILDEAARNTDAPDGSNASKLGIFYGTCMDSTRAEADGLTPLQPELDRIAGIRTVQDLGREVARLHTQGVNVLFRFGSTQDPKHTTQVVGGLRQAGLGLPDRDYYTKSDPASVKLRDAYEEHIARTLQLAGESASDAAAQAKRILAIETRLAKASMTRVAQRDPNAVYHPMTPAQLGALTTHFDWNSYFRAVDAPAMNTVIVAQPDFMKTVNGMLTQVPLNDWKAYLRWHLLDMAAANLSSAFVNEDFRFASALSGAKELQPRWKRCLRTTNGRMGEALGQLYVDKTFTPEAKARALEMVHNLEAALQDRLSTLEWMSDTTRAQAIAKLHAYANKIGYPDKWRDYSALVVERGPFVTNVLHASEFETHRQLAKIGKPVDRTEWGMTPPTVNAYYNPLMNEIVFPAGILQPPFYDPNADDATNYGGMGAVIGHEMTHGFDDQGRQFDAQGNLRDWWTSADAKNFTARATLVANQFDGYVAVDTLHVNGRLTLGENIADLGGLKVAYAAFEKATKGKPRKTIEGFTPEQRFFLAWARIWQRKTRPEQARTLVTVDPHSPGKWRVNGPLSNMPEFAQAFHCQASDAMVRPDSVRAQIW
jgi:putative endopeptidase